MSERTNWHYPAVLLSWAVLVAFTWLSYRLNSDYAVMIGSAHIWIHGGLPVVLGVALLLLEALVLAKAHGAARLTASVGLGFVATIVFAVSYAGIFEVVTSDDPAARLWMRAGLAFVPDVMMAVSTVALVALRQKKTSVKPAVEAVNPATVAGWRRLKDAAIDRAVAGMAVPEPPTKPSVEPSVDVVIPSVEASTEVETPSTDASVEAISRPVIPSVEPIKPSTKTATEVKKPSVKTSVEVPDPSTEPFMDAAARMVSDEVVVRKTAIELAKVLVAIDSGATDNAIKSQGIASSSTAAKVRAAWSEQRQLISV